MQYTYCTQCGRELKETYDRNVGVCEKCVEALQWATQDMSLPPEKRMRASISKSAQRIVQKLNVYQNEKIKEIKKGGTK